MAILEVKRAEPKDRRSTARRDDSNTGVGEIVTYTEPWQVLVDDARVETPRRVRFAPGLPRIGDEHPEDPRATVASVDPVLDKDSLQLYRVEIVYDTQQRDASGGGGADSGTDLPRIEFRLVPIVEPFEKDINGKAVVNSAGDPFVPAPERQKSLVEMRINGKAPFNKFKPVMQTDWKDTVNQRPLLTFAIGKCLLQGFDAATAVETDVVVWQLGLTWLIDDSHLAELLDRGRHQVANPAFNPESQSVTVKIEGRKQILTELGLPVDEPVLLNGRGQPLEDGDPVFLRFDAYKEQDHNRLLRDLGLPTNLAEYAIVPK